MTLPLRAGGDEMTAQYEQLRNDALSGRSGQAIAPGLALFVRNGMIAWMRAWSPYMRNVNTETTPQPSPSHATPLCLLEIRGQLTAILVGVILSQRWEVNQ
jgi:hypothetical protein